MRDRMRDIEYAIQICRIQRDAGRTMRYPDVGRIVGVPCEYGPEPSPMPFQIAHRAIMDSFRWYEEHHEYPHDLSLTEVVGALPAIYAHAVELLEAQIPPMGA